MAGEQETTPDPLASVEDLALIVAERDAEIARLRAALMVHVMRKNRCHGQPCAPFIRDCGCRVEVMEAAHA